MDIQNILIEDAIFISNLILIKIIRLIFLIATCKIIVLEF